jgi:hypothetical protein
MTKLEELHVKPFDEINPFSPYDTNRVCQRAKDNDLMAKSAAEITTDVAFKFAEWVTSTEIEGNFYQHHKDNIWHGQYNPETRDYNPKTTEELFNEFINNHYEKNINNN